ncbi:MAG: helicase-related protein [Acidimicrobiales bacterium]
MTSFDAERHLTRLKQFQRATVDHVFRRLYLDDHPGRRFLVADETGLGKSLVARGVIARAIQHLSEHSASERIDIVYVCSNAEIATQNLRRLDVLESGSSHHATRLTRLAESTHELDGEIHAEVGKRVNLVSFTPGTSFDMGNQTGQAAERALLHRILTEAAGYVSAWDLQAAAVVLRGNSGLERFRRAIDRLDIDPDAAITEPFQSAIAASGVLEEFQRAVEDLGRRTTLDEAERVRHKRLIGELRTALAAAGVEALQPDLVILDEFQRFRHLLARDDPRHQEAAELAHALFEHGTARVLLLSATPYKPFTYAEEVGGDEHGHEADLRRTLGFLCDGTDGALTVDHITSDLAAYRGAATTGGDPSAIRSRLEGSLTRVMCRTERPRLGDDGMLAIHGAPVGDLKGEDFVSFAALRQLAEHLDVPLAVDYWKSTPYFANFSDGYLFGARLREAADDPQERPLLAPHLARTQLVDRHAVADLQQIEPGNARMRRLIDTTVGEGWWKLLWVPPSVPYDEPGGPFAGVKPMTKRLIFSSWAATPTAIASLVSHEARYFMSGGQGPPSTTTTRLDWRAPDGRPGAMTTLALFWPSPALANQVIPGQGSSPVPTEGSLGGAEAWYWTTIFETPGAIPHEANEPREMAGVLAGDTDKGAEPHGRLVLHVELADALHRGEHMPDAERRTQAPGDLEETLDAIARFGPGNIALRCLRRLIGPGDSVTDFGVWSAAALIAGAAHSLFNRPDTIALIDQVTDRDVVYWRRVLQYCAWGNLEAVLDEYLHHLAADQRAVGLDDTSLHDIARRVGEALTLRPSQYRAFDPSDPEHTITFSSRFALRYGNKRGTEDESARLPEIRDAFNSPFRPFVLATTSVGQEGLDFHWWCHAVLHWNTPANPVDFEQREGRVHRYGGHAIRKNLADQFRTQMVEAARAGVQPWDVAYEMGVASASSEHGELTPFWILGGNAKVERHLVPYPLSTDIARYEQLKNDLTLYRLTFGQPRQEDLVALLHQRGVHLDADEIARLRLDLRPFQGVRHGPAPRATR